MKNKKTISLILITLAAISVISATDFASAANASKNYGRKFFNREKNKPCVTGEVSTINGTTIILTGKQKFDPETETVEYTIDASKATLKKISPNTEGKISETEISLSDIKVGDTISVRGEITGTSIIAEEIKIGCPEKQKNFKGTGQGIKHRGLMMSK